MLQNLNWPSLEIRRTRVRLIMFYKIIHHVAAIHPLYYYQLPQLPDTIVVIHINISGQTKTHISIHFILQL